MEKNRTDPILHRWSIPEIWTGFAVDSTHITFGEVFAIFFIQPRSICEIRHDEDVIKITDLVAMRWQ
jgi:hypothetical protein